MELIKCGQEYLEETAAFYRNVVSHLEETVNYPKWTRNYPNRESVETSIRRGEQYVYVDKGKVVGAVVLNENPDGDYEAGDWRVQLDRGEYLVIHTFAVNPGMRGQGIGSHMADACIELARRKGYKAIRLDVVPGNTPAVRLYKGKGFTFAGAKDLLRKIEDIPVFELYELDLTGTSEIGKSW